MSSSVAAIKIIRRQHTASCNCHTKWHYVSIANGGFLFDLMQSQVLAVTVITGESLCSKSNSVGKNPSLSQPT